MSRRHRRWLYAAFAAVWVTGAAWLPVHYFLRTEGEYGPQPHVLEQPLIRAHGAAMLLALIAFGSLFSHHLPRGWRTTLRRRSGVINVAALTILILTGYALYYFRTDENGARLSAAHWVPGLLAPVAIVVHVMSRRRRA